MENFDAIVIGAGSVGIPIALNLGQENLRVLVIDSATSPGQGNNKRAIGGIRATHSDFGKIQISRRSIEIFATWKNLYGDDIGWFQNGYSFPAYSDEDEKKLKDLMAIQHSFGLDIRWLRPDDYQQLVPGINMNGLRGATYSPGDGSASPLLMVNAMYFKSLKQGVHYRFQETVNGFKIKSDRISGVVTDKGEYGTAFVVNASGNHAQTIGRLAGITLPVTPDAHEGAITEPVQRFFRPMIVDMRPAEDSLNYYFYQNNEGQVVFCITPHPSIWGEDSDSTSRFFPQVARRMIDLFPKLAQLKVRRSWRGQYPMTPDGFPIVGFSREVPNLLNCVGMCGQGFMLGPGLGELASRLIIKKEAPEDRHILESFDPYRSFSGMEAFK